MRKKPFDGRNNVFSFVGDSRMRDLFRAFNQAVGFDGDTRQMHTNSEFKDRINGITSVGYISADLICLSQFAADLKLTLFNFKLEIIFLLFNCRYKIESNICTCTHQNMQIL